MRSQAVQRLRLLAGRRATRWETRRFVIEGPKLLDEALAAGAAIESVYVEPASAGTDHLVLAGRARDRGAHLYETEVGVLARACDTATPQPVAAVVEMVDRTLDQLSAVRPDLVVVAVDLQDPGNAGTVIRSAAASGAGAVVFCAGAVDVFNPKTVRASAGSVFHIPVVAGPPAEDVLDAAAAWGLRRVATVARGGCAHDQYDLAGPTAIVLGSESHGIPDRLADRLDALITIPMVAASESLNVAMAATVVCFEAARQRRRDLAGGEQR